jgi:RNA binding exosome subunit
LADARPRYHWLKLRAVAHPTEDVAKVEASLRFVSGLDEAAFAAARKDTPMDTHHGLTLHVLEATVEKSRAIRDVLERVFALPGALDRLRATADARVDDDGILYLRLDKQAAHDGRLELLDGEDAVQARLKLESYPATRAAAVAAVQAMLASGRP